MVRCTEVTQHDGLTVQCVNINTEGRDSHQGMHVHGSLLWGVRKVKRLPDAPKWREPGACYPEHPGELALAMNQVTTPLGAMQIALKEMKSETDRMARTSQEYGWFYGMADAIGILETAMSEYRRTAAPSSEEGTR